MRVSLRFVVTILAVICVAISCSGRSDFNPPISSSKAPNKKAATNRSKKPTRWMYFSVSKSHRVVFVGVGGDPELHRLPMAQIAAASPSPSPAPSPTATPWCGTFSGYNCYFLTPGGDAIGAVFWCSDCTSPPPWGYWFVDYANNQSYPPVTGFSAIGNTSTNSTPVDCTQECSGLQTCWQPYPTCWVQLIWSADRNTLPANMIDGVFMDGTGEQADFIWTIRPTVLDLNINGTELDQTVSLIDKQSGTPSPWPSPMVGAAVQLQASPAAGLTNVAWHFDSTSDVVGDYALKDNVGFPPSTIVSVSSPSPLPAGAINPLSLYWITGGKKHLYVTAEYPNVQGPLIADVYYNVGTPVPSVTANPVLPVAMPSNYPQVVNGVPNCQTGQLAVAVGNPCNSAGITWTYSASDPSNGGGSIAMVQLGQLSSSGALLNATAIGPSSSAGLDGTFPYASPAPVSSTWSDNDSPAALLSSPATCKSFTITDQFTDYFMYQPAASTTRSGSRLWVTIKTMTWNWTGAISSNRAGVYSFTNRTVNPAPSVQQSTALPIWSAVLGSVLDPC